jgi:hypothetical protein
MPPIIHAGLDESGSLTAATQWFVMAAVFSTHPEEIKDLIRRAALQSGKKLKRERKLHGELKWHNASERVRKAVLYHLGQADVAVYSLAVRKEQQFIATGQRRACYLSSMSTVNVALWCSWLTLSQGVFTTGTGSAIQLLT